jgi:hypothetical protein
VKLSGVLGLHEVVDFQEGDPMMSILNPFSFVYNKHLQVMPGEVKTAQIFTEVQGATVLVLKGDVL